MKRVHKILGPSRDEIWRQFCVKIGADYESSSGHWFSERVIRANHRNWTIVLDTHQLPGGRFPTVCTRMHVLFVSKDGFRFSLNRKDTISTFMKVSDGSHPKVGPPQVNSFKPLFGIESYLDMKQVETNFCSFDEEFVLKANDEAKLRLLFKDSKIRESIQSQKSLSLELSDVNQAGVHFTNDVYELSAYANGLVRDLAELETLYNIVIHILDTLCSIESAVESTP